MFAMSCHVCSRAPNPRLPFCCATCARSHLYQLRVEHAKVLLEKEVIGKQIEDAVARKQTRGRAGETDGVIPESATEGHSRWAVQAIANRQANSSARTKTLRDRIEALATEINDKKLDISQRRLTLARRNSDSESAKYQLPEREGAMLTAIQNNTRRTEHLWHNLHTKTTDARIFLCREAANIYGLRQKSKRINGDSKETYVLGGATAAHISTSFSNIAHLLVLISHYLSLRLPAEITLPHRDYPTATIYAPARSYLSREPPSDSPAQSSSSGPAASRMPDPRHYVPRPRPLFIDRSLPKLAREDPGAYALFLEGATLLAWNVSWLCRTQGLNLASDSWEEVCDIGKNIWQLLVAPPVQASTLMKAYTSRDIPLNSRAPKDSPKTTIQRTKTFSMLGHYSHGTAHSFLDASEGTEFMRMWKLPTPTKVVDKLKSTLLGEMASAEWELLEEKEWDDEAQEPSQSLHKTRFPIEQNRDRGLGPEKKRNNHTTLPGAGISRNEDAKPESANEPTSSGRSKGTSGWTKLRNR